MRGIELTYCTDCSGYLLKIFPIMAFQMPVQSRQVNLQRRRRDLSGVGGTPRPLKGYHVLQVGGQGRQLTDGDEVEKI